MSAWGCPHDANGICQRVVGAICSPGMRGCVLEGRVRFADPAMNQARKPAKPAAVENKTEARQESNQDKGKAPRRRLPF